MVMFTLRSILGVKHFRQLQFSSSAVIRQDVPIQASLVSTDLPQVHERRPLPIITSRKLDFNPEYRIARQAWVDNLDTLEEQKLGIIDLHPTIFGQFPRLDILHENIRWQSMYKHINWKSLKTRAEMPGGGKKPWPQKGLGRARHGSVRSPIFLNGGKAHGPRGPKTYYFMLTFHKRVMGLCIALSSKFAQDDIKIVDSLDIPTEDPNYLEKLAQERNWGVSVLFVDDTDIMPQNITLATDTMKSFHLMPVYGLNVYSMLKHETLVLTTAAVERIEERLLFQLHRNDSHSMSTKSSRGIQSSGSLYYSKT